LRASRAFHWRGKGPKSSGVLSPYRKLPYHPRKSKHYQHVEKLALAAVQAVQRFRHYILSRKTIVISHCNPMQHILTRQLLGGKYSKWIVILQEFDLEFDHATSKKSLVFAELICDFPHTATEKVAVDSLPDESLFLISTDDIWYGDIIIYLQTQTFRPAVSSAERRRIRYQARHYIVGYVLYSLHVCVWVQTRALPLHRALPRGVPAGGRYAPPWLRAAPRNFFWAVFAIFSGFCYF
jgi:hypothetical protein